MRALSELEGCVLGLLWKQKCTTAYAIRRSMLDSPSSHWSGSAGAIYPLLERLEKRGLVRSRSKMSGDREGWHYTLTPRGRVRFLDWLGPPFTPDVVCLAADPLRTRAHFMGALAPRKREKFLADARAELERHLRALKVEPEFDEYDRMAMRAAIRVTRAKMQWLDEVGRELARRSPE
jgi:DNA-binding PadR family transcriptional regulator